MYVRAYLLEEKFLVEGEIFWGRVTNQQISIREHRVFFHFQK